MKRLIIFLVVILCTHTFTRAFSQEYDFDIPVEEEPRIEFNGNLDAKWGMLQTRKSSPFYGLQFYDDSEKSDYLSQYRLDFYLDGAYRHKQVGLYMKTFYQYAREEPLSPSFYELYGSLNISPRWSMSIGKRRFNWGKGYAFNPVGYVNAEKDPENPDLALAGKTSVYISYNRSFTSNFVQNFSLGAIMLPPEAEINQKFASADKIGAAIKLYCLLNNIDIDFMTVFKKDEPQRFGLDFSTNLRENLEIHAEFSYAYDENIYRIVDDSIYHNKIDSNSYLIGLRYINRFNTTLITEYYRNKSGLSKNEFTSYVNYLQNSMESNIPELANSAKSNMSTYFRSKTLMKDYLYVKLIQPEPFSWLYTSISISTIYNLVDKSFLFSPQLSYKPYTNSEVLLWPILFFGDNNTEYGSKQFEKKIEIWMRYYF
ncbi:MAG: hypothetical protein HOC71_03550 [Candidatus Latescibacteria bacterium]|jgi:hypothetical protein|nr:hypothetical protein [Candidatus Latescibacterota bacterium]